MKQEQIDKAVALGNLLEQAREMGASISVGEIGEVHLVGAGEQPQRLGDNLVAAAAELSKLTTQTMRPLTLDGGPA